MERKGLPRGRLRLAQHIENTFSAYKPDVIAVNAGAAQFHQGDLITMTFKRIN
jgi:hypothetical protein